MPYTPNFGGGALFFTYLKILSAQNDITLISFVDDEKELKYIDNLRPYCLSVFTVTKKIRTIKHRDMTFWNALKSFFSLTPYHINKFFSKNMRKKINGAIESNNYDAILVVDIGMAHYLNGHNSFPKVLFQPYIESVFYEEYAQLTKNILLKCWAVWEAKKIRRYEEKIFQKFDRIVTVTQKDADYLKLKTKDVQKYFSLPIAIDTDFFSSSEEEPKEKNILLVGSLFWYPNLDQTRWFLKDIFPLIKSQIPKAILTVVGEGPPKDILKYGDKSDIFIFGYVEDVRPYLKDATVVAVPTRICGGGVRTKILTALAAKVPVVATRVSCEGIGLIPGKHLLVADTEKDFADAVVEVLEDSDLRRKLTINGYSYLLENFSPQKVHLELERLLFDLTNCKLV